MKIRIALRKRQVKKKLINTKFKLKPLKSNIVTYKTKIQIYKL